MRVSHEFTAVFDDPNLVSCAGLAPVLQLAEGVGLHQLTARHLHIGKTGGANAHLKILALVAGMVAGADSIDDMELLRHGGMSRLVEGVRAPSTWTTPSSGPTASPSRAPAAATPASKGSTRCSRPSPSQLGAGDRHLRLRKGSTNIANGSAKLIGEALGTANKCGASGC